MTFSLATIWYERNRFLPGILAVAFSAMLITVQFGLLLGLLSLTSIPVDLAGADIWVGHPAVLSVDIGRPIPEAWMSRVAEEPEVDRVEKYILWLLMADTKSGHTSICTVIGARQDEDSLGAPRIITPELRDMLSEPGSVVADESDLKRLGFNAVGDEAEVMGHRVRLVGTVRGAKSLAAPYLFCSVETAYRIINFIPRDQTVYLLASCHNPLDAPAVAARLRRQYSDMSVYTRHEFSNRTRWHWLTATKSGMVLGVCAVLGLLVGAVVTSFTLYAATAASLREYATLRALGIPSTRIAGAVLAQAFWVGSAGIVIAAPATFGIARLVDALGARVNLPFWLLAGSAATTLTMALVSGLAALRSLRLLEPVELLR
jgi:putative ABC transport system permease protein